MSVWDWVQSYEQRARADKDALRIELCTLQRQGIGLRNTDPDGALTLLRRGRDLAVRLRESWWVIFFDHWTIQVLLNDKGNFTAALDLAVRSAVEVRKPEYAQLPQRICIHEDLIKTYKNIDPFGYAPAIESALEYMQTQVDPSLECYYCHLNLKTTFACAVERYAEAEDAAAQFLAITDETNDPHYQGLARFAPCFLAFRREAWDELLALAHEGQTIILGKLRESYWIVEFMMWEALALRHLNRDEEARRAYQNALARAARLKSLPHLDFYTAACAYHEYAGEFAAALALRDQSLREAETSGSPYHTARAHLRRCELRAKMGNLNQADLTAAKAAANRLKKPDAILTLLDKIKLS